MKSDTMEITQLITRSGNQWTVGNNCDYVEEHSAGGEGDRWFYDVYLHEKNQMIRIFDPLEVVFLIDRDK
jgi:hypothetical protein